MPVRKKKRLHTKGFKMTNTNIQIVDSVMGSGKTTSIIDYINSSSKPIIIIVERQSEVERLKKECSSLVALSDISTQEKTTRRDALETCVNEGKSIISTHHLFKFWSDYFLNKAQYWGYELIMDETLSGVLSSISIKSDDLRKYVDDGYIQVCAGSKLGKVKLTKSLHSKYADVENKISKKDCYLFNSSKADDPHYMLIEAPRAEIFSIFKVIKVLTYKFDGSLLRCYFDMHDIKYSMMSIRDGQMASYTDLKGVNFKDKLHIYDGKHNQVRGKNIGTKTWIDHKVNQNEMSKRLRNVFYFWERYGVTSGTFLYTTHKYTQKFVHPKNIKGLKNSLNESYSDPNKKESMTDDEKRNVSFLSQTIRGTNDFSHKKFMAFTCNTFLDPQINHFLKHHDVELNEEAYALNRMIQWLWRGCIRNDEEMYVFIPSKRMRYLLLDWLSYSDKKLI